MQFFVLLGSKTKPKLIKTNSQRTPLSFLEEKNNVVSLCIFLTPEFLKATFLTSQDRSQQSIPPYLGRLAASPAACKDTPSDTPQSINSVHVTLAFLFLS